MDGDEVARFLDVLYGTALDQSLWVPAMERLADLLGGSSCWLSRLHVANGTGSGIISRIDPAMPARYLADYASRNPFSNADDPEDYIRRWSPRIRFHDDFMPRDQVVRTAFYNDFLKPQNIVSTMMIGLSSGGFETCVLNVNHATASFDAPQVALAHRLHPHLRRAFALSCALGESDSRLASPDALAALEGVGYGIVLVDAEGRVRHANKAAAALTGAGAGLRVEHGVLSASDRASAQRLATAIGAATAREADRRTGTSVAITRAGEAALKVAVSPLHSGNHPVFSSVPLAMVTAFDAAAARVATASRIGASYGLTPAETRVAMALLDGCSPREAAIRLGISVNTVRNQLQALYDKTGTNRQSALVLVLSNSG